MSDRWIHRAAAESGGGGGSRSCVALEHPSSRETLSITLMSGVLMAALHGSPVRAGDFPQLPSEGVVRCWGSNNSGQCDVPSDLGPVASVAAGFRFTVALRLDGSVRCWGQCDVPSDLGPVSAISAGRSHSVALLADGSVRCWGSNNYGQCSTPPDLGPVVAVAAGDLHTVALLANGGVRCWGSNDYSQCDVPPDLGPVSAVSAGALHTVVVLAGGSVRCWGQNWYGECDVPTDLGPVSAVSAGDQYTTALLSDGSVRCWGNNSDGQCSVPSDLGRVVLVSAGDHHTMAVLESGSVRCWGYGCSVPPDLGPVSIIAVSRNCSPDYCGGSSHTVAVDLNGHVVEEGGSIQAAIEAASDGELVAIRPGIYTERIDLMGKAITLWGLGGPGAVVIESTGLSGSTVSVSGVHEQRAQLVGLTIRGGSVGTPVPGSKGLVGGGGVYLEDSNALIYDCRIEACSAEVGGGVFAVGGSPRFVRCTMEGSHAADDGGGAMLAESAGSFALCEFIGNTAAGLGGGLYASRGEPLIERSAFRGNTAGRAGGGIGWYAGASPMTLRRVALASNESKIGGGRPGCVRGTPICCSTMWLFAGAARSRSWVNSSRAVPTRYSRCAPTATAPVCLMWPR